MREGTRRWLVRGSWVGLAVTLAVLVGLRLGRPLYYTDGERQVSAGELAASAVIEWSSPEVAFELPGPVEGRVAILPDGRMLYGRRTGDGTTDLVVFDPERPAIPPERAFELDTPDNELAPAVGPGGEVYFASDRPGGEGGYDLYRSRWSPRGFTRPEPLTVCNTARDETDPAPGRDGDDFVFVRIDPGRRGRDGVLWRCRLQQGTEPRRLFANPARRLVPVDRDPAFAPGGGALWFVRREVGGEVRLLRVTVLGDEVDDPVVVGDAWGVRRLRAPDLSGGQALGLLQPRRGADGADLWFRSFPHRVYPWWPGQRWLEWLLVGLSSTFALLLLLLLLGRRWATLDLLAQCLLLSLLLHVLIGLWLMGVEIGQSMFEGRARDDGIEVTVVTSVPSGAAAMAKGRGSDVAAMVRFTSGSQAIEAELPAAGAERARRERPEVPEGSRETTLLAGGHEARAEVRDSGEAWPLRDGTDSEEPIAAREVATAAAPQAGSPPLPRSLPEAREVVVSVPGGSIARTEAKLSRRVAAGRFRPAAVSMPGDASAPPAVTLADAREARTRPAGAVEEPTPELAPRIEAERGPAGGAGEHAFPLEASFAVRDPSPSVGTPASSLVAPSGVARLAPAPATPTRPPALPSAGKRAPRPSLRDGSPGGARPAAATARASEADERGIEPVARGVRVGPSPGVVSPSRRGSRTSSPSEGVRTPAPGTELARASRSPASGRLAPAPATPTRAPALPSAAKRAPRPSLRDGSPEGARPAAATARASEADERGIEPVARGVRVGPSPGVVSPSRRGSRTSSPSEGVRTPVPGTELARASRFPVPVAARVSTGSRAASSAAAAFRPEPVLRDAPSRFRGAAAGAAFPAEEALLPAIARSSASSRPTRSQVVARRSARDGWDVGRFETPKPPGSMLERRRGHAAAGVRSGSPVAVTPYSNRFGPRKAEALEQHGGSAETERAVRDGLRYLAAKQNLDGSWGPRDEFDRKYGRIYIGKTALCVLAFLGAGHTPVSGTEYSGVVNRALAHLLAVQDEETGAFGPSSCYGHGIATYAIAECYGMTRDPALRRPLEEALSWILRNQGPRRDIRNRGGWGYFSPGLRAEDSYARVSVTSWMVMALESARLSGIDLPEEVLPLAREYLELAYDRRRGWFRYNHEPSRLRSAWPTLPASTPAAAFCLQLLGVPSDDRRVRKALRYTVVRRPRAYRSYGRDDFVLRGQGNVYFWYYGSLCCFLAGGEAWDSWNERLSTVLPEAQSEDGSFRPIDYYAEEAGDTDDDRSYTTAMCVLSLEVYYRYFTPLLLGR